MSSQEISAMRCLMSSMIDDKHWQLLFFHWIKTDYPCSHGNGADRLILTWLACQDLSAPIWHLYSCRSYMQVHLYTIKLFMCAYRHLVARSAELLNQSRLSVPRKHRLEFPSWTRHYYKTICESDKPLGSSVISYRVHWSQPICNHLTQL